jgi:hypothetical protein
MIMDACKNKQHNLAGFVSVEKNDNILIRIQG